MSNKLDAGQKALNVGTKLGTDLLQPIALYPPFPKQLFILESVDFFSYTQILEYFTNEDKFFSLTPVHGLTGGGQRMVRGGKIAITVSGMVTPDQKMVLTQKVKEAGVYECEICAIGEGNCAYTIIALSELAENLGNIN